MATLHLLYAKDYAINDNISVMIPKVGDILDNEDEYYNLVALLTAAPIDLLVQLDDIGIDFSTINDYELFLMLFDTLKDSDTSMIFGDLDLRPFEKMVNEQNGTIVLRDNNTGVIIDRAIHNQIAVTLRAIHHLERDKRKPGNEEARKYMIRRAREKMRRNKKRTTRSQLEDLIVAMVNTEQYKYDFEGTRELSIYQFNESVRQVVKKVEYEHKMAGVYAGTISSKDLSQDDFNWLTHK